MNANLYEQPVNYGNMVAELLGTDPDRRLCYTPTGKYRGDDRVSDFLCLGEETSEGYTRYLLRAVDQETHADCTHLTSYGDYFSTIDDYDGADEEMAESELYRLYVGDEETAAAE